MRPFLLCRRGEEPFGVVAVPLVDGADGIDIAGMVCKLADDGWHDRTDWCVVWAERAALARWPDPEPWAS